MFNDGKNITIETLGREPVEQSVARFAAGDAKWQANLNQPSLELGWYQKSKYSEIRVVATNARELM